MKTVVVTFCLLLSSCITNAGDEELIPIHAFRREMAPEMVYTIDSEEIARLKRTEGWHDKGILGFGSARDGKGLIKLQRAHRGRWHVFYTKAPKQLPKGTELEVFDVWVWEKPAEGLLPVYATSLLDWRDMIFSTDKDDIKQAIEDSWNAAKVKRVDHGVMFYLKPMTKSE